MSQDQLSWSIIPTYITKICHQYPHCAALHCTALRCTVPQYITPHDTALNWTAPCRTVPYCTVLYRTVLYRTVLYRTVLYRTVPHRAVPYCTVPAAQHATEVVPGGAQGDSERHPALLSRLDLQPGRQASQQSNKPINQQTKKPKQILLRHPVTKIQQQ